MYSLGAIKVASDQGPPSQSPPKSSSRSSSPLLEARDVQKVITTVGHLGRTKDIVRAVDGVSFSVTRGQSFGIVGETGSGKSTLARMITRLTEPTSGDI